MYALGQARLWKISIICCSLLAIAIATPSILESPAFLGPPKVGTLGAKLQREPHLGSRRLVIDSLQPDSPLRAAGAELGDKLQWDNPMGPLSTHPGETVGLTLYNRSGSKHVVAIFAAGDDPNAEPATTQTLALAYALTGLAFGLVIGFKRPDRKAYRYLAVAFLFIAINSIEAFSAPGMNRKVALLAHAVSMLPTWGGYLMFALLYPNDDPQRLRGLLYRWRWVPIAALSALVIGEVIEFTGYYVPYSDFAARAAIFITGAVIVAALLDGWLTSERELRTRHLWVMLAFGFKIAILEANWAQLIPRFDIYLYLQLSCHLLMLYAILKHRILDFGFFVNRALVYSITSVALLIAFGVTEWLAEKLLHFEGREQNLILDGTIAVGLIAVFHRFHHEVDHVINRLVFHRWHANESALRLFVKRAAFFAQPDSLTNAFGSELRRFTNGASCAIYRRSLPGEYQCIYGGPGAPLSMSFDDGAAIALRAEDSPLSLKDVDTVLSGELALPMTHRAALHGFAVLGAKPGGESYRPDEIEALKFAVRHVGLDLLAMEIEALETKINRLDIETRVLREQLQAGVAVSKTAAPDAQVLSA